MFLSGNCDRNAKASVRAFFPVTNREEDSNRSMNPDASSVVRIRSVVDIGKPRFFDNSPAPTALAAAAMYLRTRNVDLDDFTLTADLFSGQFDWTFGLVRQVGTGNPRDRISGSPSQAGRVFGRPSFSIP